MNYSNDKINRDNKNSADKLTFDHTVERRLEWITRPLDSVSDCDSEVNEEELDGVFSGLSAETGVELRESWEWFGKLLDNASDQDFLSSAVTVVSSRPDSAASESANPIPRTPPAMEKPAMEKPAIDKPAIDKPAIDKPAIDKPAVDAHWFRFRRTAFGALTAAAIIMFVVTVQSFINTDFGYNSPVVVTDQTGIKAGQTDTQAGQTDNIANNQNVAAMVVSPQPEQELMADSQPELDPSDSYLAWTEDEAYDTALNNLAESFAEYSPGDAWSVNTLVGYETIGSSFEDWETDCSDF